MRAKILSFVNIANNIWPAWCTMRFVQPEMQRTHMGNVRHILAYPISALLKNASMATLEVLMQLRLEE